MFFNIVLYIVIKEVKNKKLLVGYRNLTPVYITEGVFADNLMVCAENQKLITLISLIFIFWIQFL